MLSLMLAALYVTVACAGNYVCSLLIDRVGRVKLLRKSSSHTPSVSLLPLRT